MKKLTLDTCPMFTALLRERDEAIARGDADDGIVAAIGWLEEFEAGLEAKSPANLAGSIVMLGVNATDACDCEHVDID